MTLWGRPISCVDLIVVGGLGHEWSVRHNSIALSFLARHQIETRP